MKGAVSSAFIRPADVIYSPFGQDRTIWLVIALVIITAVMTAAVLLAVRAVKYLKRSPKKEIAQREVNDDE